LLVVVSVLNNDILKTGIHKRWIENTRTVANCGTQPKVSSSIPGGGNSCGFHSFSRSL